MLVGMILSDVKEEENEEEKEKSKKQKRWRG